MLMLLPSSLSSILPPLSCFAYEQEFHVFEQNLGLTTSSLLSDLYCETLYPLTSWPTRKVEDNVTPAQISLSLSPSQPPTSPLFHNACTQTEPSNQSSTDTGTGGLERREGEKTSPEVGLETPAGLFVFWWNRTMLTLLNNSSNSACCVSVFVSRPPNDPECSSAPKQERWPPHSPCVNKQVTVVGSVRGHLTAEI